MKAAYAVIYEKTGTGYSAYAPDLPGCITTGATREETERLMVEAIEFHIAGMREDGEVIPEPTTLTAMLTVSEGASVHQDRTKCSPQDASRINVHELYELEYWSKKFGVTTDQLKAAVSKVGVSVAAVEDELAHR
jgi:predicted RNase H-like HicB family nuclease